MGIIYIVILVTCNEMACVFTNMYFSHIPLCIKVSTTVESFLDLSLSLIIHNNNASFSPVRGKVMYEKLNLLH